MMALDPRKASSLSAKLAQVPTLLLKAVSARNVDNVGSEVLCLTLDAYHSLIRNLLVCLLRVVQYQVIITATPSPDKKGLHCPHVRS
uniref:Putative secreted protein n=1 Tax=Ixodes ricinus TaxID=34613 RepID=A0A6B0U1T4_IXORI